jgi:hypothetical protein
MDSEQVRLERYVTRCTDHDVPEHTAEYELDLAEFDIREGWSRARDPFALAWRRIRAELTA